MHHNPLGNTGLEVSVIGLGMEHLQPTPPENGTRVVRRAVERGINYIDLMIWTH
jgi:aryl-alcohol dehydrogenase-like predicted oxidoreductase